MAYDGNGNFVRLHNWTQDAANSIDINSLEMDAEDGGFAAGLSNCVTRDGQGKMSVDFTPAVDNTLNLGTASKRWKTLNGVTVGALPVSIAAYGALSDNVTDDTAAVNAAITGVSAGGGGLLYFPQGTTTKCTGTVVLAANVTIMGYGATLNYTGVGIAVSCPTTASLIRPGIFGLVFNAPSASVILNLISCYRGAFRDLHLLSNSTTNTAIALTCNTTGTPDPAGTLNFVNCLFENIMQDATAGGNGCGNFITFNGNTSIQGIVTDNTFVNVQAQAVNIVGIDMIQWCDSNIFCGMTRIALNGAISPANGIGLRLGTGQGVYSESFQQLAIDTFANPATDNRQGVVCTAATSTKNVVISVLEFGPAVTNQALNVPTLLSGVIVLAPRLVTNYQSYNLYGANVGIGVAANTANACTASAGAWMTGVSQSVYYAQASAYNQGAPTLGVSYGCQPGAAGSGSPYTVTQVMGYYAAAGVNGANATVTNSYGFYCADQNYGASNNYGYFSNMVAGAGKFGFYAAGTAANSFAGPTAIGGSATNDSAAAGFVAEIITSLVGSGSAVSLSNTVPANITSISLTAGDWDVWGQIAFIPAASTTLAYLAASTGTTTGALGGLNIAANATSFSNFAPGAVATTQSAPVQRLSLAGTTTVYLVAQANFGVSTMSAYGGITARRRR